MARTSPLLLFFFLFIVFIKADFLISPTFPPQELRSFKIQDSKESGYYCTYTVKIKTSCYSPRYTRDAISLAFGDFYGNQVYAPRLDDPSSYTFESCSTDTFQLSGPCGYGVCYLYLYRYGPDGWTPDSVTIYESNGRTTSFYYGVPLPNGVWYGFDQCLRASDNSVSIK